jgi:heavy metal sensor kinase
MRSIRLSLVIYFLGLLALALGAVSVLAYRTAQQTLDAKKVATEELIRAQCNERSNYARHDLDETLHTQAQTLAAMMGPIGDPHLFGLGLLSAVQAPSGYFLTPLWINESVRGPLHGDVWRLMAREIKVKDSDRLATPKRQVASYFQIDSVWGSYYLSPSLQGQHMPLDIPSFGAGEALYDHPDTIELRPGLRVRRVIQKMPAPMMVPIAPTDRSPRPRSETARGESPPRDGPRNDSPRPENPRSEGARMRPPPSLPDGLPRPSIYIHYACSTGPLEAELAALENGRDEDLARVEAETTASLAQLRNRLLLINGVTFATVALGCLWLVGVGLAPLRRLSEAVSRLTPRDLSLPVSTKRLPRELRPIVDRLTRALSQLGQAFAREKQATADISHELRTPLAALLTTTELALRKPRSAEEYRELLADCRASGLQMNHAIERLLTLARLDAGVAQLRPCHFDLASLAEQCAAVIRPLAQARGLSLSVHRNGPAPLSTDVDMLREVMTNLLHNAVQYNRPQGSIDLSVTQDADHLELAVADTGIGIAEEARPHIFERFYRADPSRGADGLHAGLGLSIVKEYVHLMGGTIKVESCEGQGSTFRVRLPRNAETSPR